VLHAVAPKSLHSAELPRRGSSEAARVVQAGAHGCKPFAVGACVRRPPLVFHVLRARAVAAAAAARAPARAARSGGACARGVRARRAARGARRTQQQRLRQLFCDKTLTRRALIFAHLAAAPAPAPRRAAPPPGTPPGSPTARHAPWRAVPHSPASRRVPLASATRARIDDAQRHRKTRADCSRAARASLRARHVNRRAAAAA
jgi:hypothetical protein